MSKNNANLMPPTVALFNPSRYQTTTDYILKNTSQAALTTPDKYLPFSINQPELCMKINEMLKFPSMTAIQVNY